MFNVQCSAFNGQCKVAVGSFGKRSNLDIKWKRKFILQRHNKLNNYIGVKYHIKTNWPEDLIALHNFQDGYCGISQVEENKYCLCYLTTAKNLERCANSIHRMEREILCRNPHLKRIFENAEMVSQSPVTISQISFEKKEQVFNHLLLTGDAAGMIAPLCGNGMSMAIRASKILAQLLTSYFNETITKTELIKEYDKAWNNNFNTRIKSGYYLQHFFGKKNTTHYTLKALDKLPSLTKKIISLTHGQPF